MKKLFAAAVAVLFWLSLFAIDKGWLPVMLCAVSWLCLAVMAHRNGWYYEPKEDEDNV